MGRDAKTSVVDRTLTCHDHPNMFILGSTVFPTSATGNPTLTIAALSLRAVASVKAALRSGGGIAPAPCRTSRGGGRLASFLRI